MFETREQIVAEIRRRCPDYQMLPGDLWAFVNAGWNGPVDESGMDDWEEAWKDACCGIKPPAAS